MTRQAPIPILMYHQIAPTPAKGTPFRSLSVAPGSFEKQMSMLKMLGYHGLSMSALLPYLRGESKGKVVGITFDDGYLNNLTHALPVLQVLGFSSTCYVVSQLLGKTNEWDREIGIPDAELMSAHHLRRWIAGAQEIGAHTRNHVHLPQLSGAACVLEIRSCKTELEQICGSSVQHFCYPYGEFAAEHVAMVRDAGYITATTTQRSRCGPDEDLLLLPRVPVARSTTRPGLWLKIATSYEDRRRQ
jgi:peptidoglycan/xylan/chitin deacetylase (PgdA/CDA1 family)